MPSKHRNYKAEDANYQGKPEQVHNRALRNKAHRMLEKALGRNVTGDVDHIKPVSKGGTTTMSNLRVTSKSANRSFSRNSDHSLKSQRSKRGK